MQAPGKECLIHLNCNLSDDKFDKNNENQDLKNFYNAVHKSKLNCTNPDNPYGVDIKAHSYIINDDVAPAILLDFKINDCPIELNKPSDRNLLPLFTFMAKLSSKIATREDISPEEKVCAEILNDYIATSATHFIDNVME